MGEALRKLKTAGREVTIDLNAPEMTIARSDLYAFAVHPGSAGCPECRPEDGRRGICAAHYTPGSAKARCVRALVHAVVRGALGSEIGRVDGKIYAAWLEALDAIDDGAMMLTLTLEAVRWLQKHASKDDAKVTLGLVQWREALVDYLDVLVERAEAESA